MIELFFVVGLLFLLWAFCRCLECASDVRWNVRRGAAEPSSPRPRPWVTPPIPPPPPAVSLADDHVMRDADGCTIRDPDGPRAQRIRASLREALGTHPVPRGHVIEALRAMGDDWRRCLPPLALTPEHAAAIEAYRANLVSLDEVRQALGFGPVTAEVAEEIDERGALRARVIELENRLADASGYRGGSGDGGRA